MLLSRGGSAGEKEGTALPASLPGARSFPPAGISCCFWYYFQPWCKCLVRGMGEREWLSELREFFRQSYRLPGVGGFYSKGVWVWVFRLKWDLFRHLNAGKVNIIIWIGPSSFHMSKNSRSQRPFGFRRSKWVCRYRRAGAECKSFSPTINFAKKAQVKSLLVSCSSGRAPQAACFVQRSSSSSSRRTTESANTGLGYPPQLLRSQRL